MIMANKKTVTPTTITYEFLNDDGSYDVWVYDTTYTPIRAIEVTSNVRRRKSKSKSKK